MGSANHMSGVLRKQHEAETSKNARDDRNPMQLISSRLGPKRRTPIRRAAEQIPCDDHGIVWRANLDPQREILRRVEAKTTVCSSRP